jgi:hypothetical protein
MLMPEVVSQVDDDSPFKGKGGKPRVGGRQGQAVLMTAACSVS